MNKNVTKRLLALALAGTMVLGSSLMAFAEGEASSATGAGTNTGHLNTDVVTAVLPTSATVANVFNFTIDPENILAQADKFTDGSTAAGSGFANEDLVYFKQADNAAKPYASSSQAVKVAAKNYVAADVTVVATVGDAASGKTIIPLVESSEALTAATTPSMLLELKVGSKKGAILSTGATVSDTIAAQNAKFDTKWDTSTSGYKVEPKTDSSIEWAGVDVQLVGKVKGGTVEGTLDAPDVTLTWTVAKHSDTFTVTYVANDGADPATANVTEDVTSGGTPTKTASTGFTKEGYRLTGWNTRADGEGDEFTAESTVSADTIVYAQWGEILPEFASAEVGKVTYNTAGLTSVTKLEVENNGRPYDAMVAYGTTYSAATVEANAETGKTTITLDSRFTAFFHGTVTGTVTYVDKAGQTQTAQVSIMMPE